MNGHRHHEYFSIEFDNDDCEIKQFDIELDFYVHEGSGKRLPATTKVECIYDPLPDEAYDEPYFSAYVGRHRFEGTTSETSAYLVLDGVRLEDLCPGLGYNLPDEMDRFQVCLDIDVCKKRDGGGYFKVVAWVYQMVSVLKST
jgi:hypothetical protein